MLYTCIPAPVTGITTSIKDIINDVKDKDQLQAVTHSMKVSSLHEAPVATLAPSVHMGVLNVCTRTTHAALGLA